MVQISRMLQLNSDILLRLFLSFNLEQNAFHRFIMFTHKQNKTQSVSKLIRLLTRRASSTPLIIKNGVYSEWPGQSKPSLMNATYFAKNFNNKKRQSTRQTKQKTEQKLKKQAALFSTCTTIQFYPQSQLTKMTCTPQSLQKETLNQTIDENYIQEQEYGQIQLNSRYGQDINNHEVENAHKYNKLRRQVKTAFVTRHIIQDSDRIHPEEKKIQKKQRKTQSVKRINSNKYSLAKLSNGTGLNQSTIVSYRLDGHQYEYQPPLRLKDYQTNFQAYKLMNKIIDEQMRWQPKRKRPKTSVKFRSYKF